MKMSVKLGDILTISRGASPRPISKYITTNSDGINWIKIGDVEPDSFYITKTEEKITPEGAKKSRLVKEGDFILSNSMSFGRPYILKINGCVHDGWLILSDYEETLISSYLYYLLRSPVIQSQFDGSANGSTVRNLNSDIVRNVKVSIHTDKKVQKDIVNRLDTIQSAIDNKKQQLSLLDEAVKSEFVEMFGEGSCKQIPFSEYAEIIDGDRGKNYPKSEDFSDDDYCLFLSAKNVTKNGFLFENNQFISKEKDEILRKGKLNRGDIVITTRGTIGNIAYFDDSIPYENIRINSGMVIIRNKDLEFNQRFFLEAFRNKIDEIIATQVTGAAQPQLPIHIMSKITLPYPDLPLQNKFAAFVQQIDKSKFIVKQQIADLQELLDSKMQEYFGE